MATYVYNLGSGELHSYCPTDDDQVAPRTVLDAKGLAVLKLPQAIDETHAWDPGTRGVIEVPAPVKPRPVTPAAWVMRFMPEEVKAIRASDDAAVQQWLFALTLVDSVDLNDPIVQGGVAFLVSAGLLTRDRAAEVLA